MDVFELQTYVDILEKKKKEKEKMERKKQEEEIKQKQARGEIVQENEHPVEGKVILGEVNELEQKFNREVIREIQREKSTQETELDR